MAQRSGDTHIAAFAQSVELALVQSYAAMSASGKVTAPPAADALATYASHHDEHARALAGVAGTGATLNASAMGVGGVEARHIAALASAVGQRAVVRAFQSTDRAVPAGTGVQA